PPKPLTATISPARMARADLAIGSEPSSWRPCRSHSSSCGPQSQHALGCAWKRRFNGSSYSARHASHMGNPAIEVYGRSYGMSWTIVNLGPQFVQLINGYPQRRSAGSNNSRKQSSQMATSGEM